MSHLAWIFTGTFGLSWLQKTNKIVKMLENKSGYYQKHYDVNPAGNHMFKVNNRNTRTRYGICSKLTIKTHISHLALVFLVLTLSM